MEIERDRIKLTVMLLVMRNYLRSRQYVEVLSWKSAIPIPFLELRLR
jgi:hypothetical protein